MDYGLWTIFGLWILVYGLLVVPAAGAAEIVIYGFEENAQGWVIPDWAKASADYVAKEAVVSQEYAAEGRSSLKVRVEFPGGRWTGAYVEREMEVKDWTPFGRLSFGVYLPADAPVGLKGRIILTVGDQFRWTEMNRSVALAPGSWTRLSVNLKPGSMDWKFFPDDQFRKIVDKIGVRIESDKQPAYSGPVFLDDVRLAE